MNVPVPPHPDDPRLTGLRTRLARLLAAGLDAVDPAGCVRRALASPDLKALLPGDSGGGGGGGGGGETRLLAVGKAAIPMARAAREVLGPIPGLVIAPAGHTAALGSPGSGCDLIEAAHPVPDERSVAAGHAALKRVGAMSPGSRLLVLISGGASALMAAPVAGISLAAKQAVTDLLLRSGADIHELNAVRRCLSRVKGGGLRRVFRGEVLVTLLLSDVRGDDPAAIGSGPTIPDPGTALGARDVLSRHGLEDACPPQVRDRLAREAPVDGPAADGSPAPAVEVVRVIASAGRALEAMESAARNDGWRVVSLGCALTGPARELAHRFLAAAVAAGTLRPLVVTGAGETTVRVTGTGRGGRNQEAVLAAVPLLDGRESAAFLSLGTDGVDGPTGAAGAVADGTSARRARELGLDWQLALAANDSHPFFERLGDLVITGPTGTNVGDMVIFGQSEPEDGLWAGPRSG